ncbi:CBU_0592 family membrane protein [Neoactinobaculum massilliense]|uniref:CBU_0592 family membrane protein n=1 Tax=Neoactinobaculum massilliense TaxID=2364794 RepID=UPI003B9688BB
MNFLGAVGFVYTALSPFNPGLFITEGVWAIVAVYGVWRIVARNRKKHASRGDAQ